MITYLIALFCVIGLAVGQVMFKLSAAALEQNGSHFGTKAILFLGGAMVLYGVTSLAWVWVLRKIELGRIYPLMALGFILVPIGSHLVFGEHFEYQYYLGVALIIAGIVLAVRS